MLSFIQHFEPFNWIYYVSFWPFHNRSTLKAYKKAGQMAETVLSAVIYIYIYVHIKLNIIL